MTDIKKFPCSNLSKRQKQMLMIIYNTNSIKYNKNPSIAKSSNIIIIPHSIRFSMIFKKMEKIYNKEGVKTRYGYKEWFKPSFQSAVSRTKRRLIDRRLIERISYTGISRVDILSDRNYNAPYRLTKKGIEYCKKNLVITVKKIEVNRYKK